MANVGQIFEDICKENDLKIIRELGKGGFGLVKEVSYKKNTYAAKLIKKETNEKMNESNYIQEFKGPGIVKVQKIFTKKIDKNTYNLILMEKAPLKSLSQFNKYIFHKNYLRLIFKEPFETIGDNLIRFYVKQIVKGLELLDRGNFSHFDLKPENILTFVGMTLKLTDFGLLRNPENEKDSNNKVRIPGGTTGYISPECYHNNYVLDIKDVKKQDFFALGATIFYLKYGEEMLEYNNYKDNSMTSDLIIDLLQKRIDEIKSGKLLDKDFIDFLCSLINYDPKERPDFEAIYRNKWLNKNTEELNDIIEINEIDEPKLILELNKSDFLIPKKKYLQERRPKGNNERQLHKFIFKNED